MPNSVILTGTSGPLNKDAVRGGGLKGTGHKGRPAAQAAGSDESSSLAESGNNQANKKGNAKGLYRTFFLSTQIDIHSIEICP